MLLIKYIDDFNGVEKLFKKNAIWTLSEHHPVSEVRAIKSELLYSEVKKWRR